MHYKELEQFFFVYHITIQRFLNRNGIKSVHFEMSNRTDVLLCHLSAGYLYSHSHLSRDHRKKSHIKHQYRCQRERTKFV